MEDSGEMHSEDDKGLNGKNMKKKIKTRAQVEGLEKLYEEHKYPTELMKSELARSSGLTEKQVSGWFCHRRLKDKRQLLKRETCANGRQDSCGSTKQGDDKNFDHREVESRRLTGPDDLAADMAYEVGTKYRAESDTPSGSSSSLQDARFSQNVEPFDMATSRYNINTDLTSVKRRTGPSGYLKVKSRVPVEHAAITAVKRQLGSLYRQDGPPLGVEFDPLPPDAFESVQNHVHVPEYAEEPVSALALTPDFSKVNKQSNSYIGYGSISKTSSYGSDLDIASFKKSLKSPHSEYYFNQKPGQNSSKNNGEHYYPVRNNSVDENDNLSRMKIPWENEIKVAKRARDAAPDHQEYMRNTSVKRMPSQADQHTRFSLLCGLQTLASGAGCTKSASCLSILHTVHGLLQRFHLASVKMTKQKKPVLLRVEIFTVDVR